MPNKLSQAVWDYCVGLFSCNRRRKRTATRLKHIHVTNLLKGTPIYVTVLPCRRTLQIVNVYNARQKVTWNWSVHDTKMYERIFIFVDKFDMFKIPLRQFQPRTAKSRLFLLPHIFPEEHILFWEDAQYGGPLHKWIVRVYKVQQKDLRPNTSQLLCSINTEYNTALKLLYCSVLIPEVTVSPGCRKCLHQSPEQCSWCGMGVGNLKHWIFV